MGQRESVIVTHKVPVPEYGGEIPNQVIAVVTVQLRVHHPRGVPRWVIAKALDDALAEARQELWSK